MANKDEYAMYGLDFYDVDCDVAQRVHEDVSVFQKKSANVVKDSPGAVRKPKKPSTLSTLHKVATRSISIQQTAQLQEACSINYENTVNVRFGAGEKLTIMFMCNNTYAVYRKSDATVAILANAGFERNPPAMLDGSKYGNLLSEVEFVLMYALAKCDHCNVGGLKFYKNDVILILAECRDTFVGITPRKRVGIFPSKLVHIISKRRNCIFKGMVLKMITAKSFLDSYYNDSRTYNDSTLHEITKSSKGLFSWIEEAGKEVSLQGLVERPNENPQQDSGIYETIHEISYSGTTLQQKKKTPLPQPGGEEDDSAQGDSLLEGETWFHGNLSRKEAENLLLENGDFLVRFMSNYPWVYVLSCKTEKGYEHFRLRLNNRSNYHTNGGEFRSIRNLIQVHQTEGKPVSKDPSTTIRRGVKAATNNNPCLKEDVPEGNDQEIIEEEEEEEEKSDQQPSTVQQSSGSQMSFDAEIAQNHKELPQSSEYPVVPPKTTTMEELYPDLQCMDTKEVFDGQREEQTNVEDGPPRETSIIKSQAEAGCVKDHSVKSLVKEFNNHSIKHSHEDHRSVNEHSPVGGGSENEVSLKEMKNESKDVQVQSDIRFDKDAMYVLEMEAMRKQIGNLTSAMESVMMMMMMRNAQIEGSKQGKHNEENQPFVAEDTKIEAVVHSVCQEETYTDTVVESDEEESSEIYPSPEPEQQEDAPKRLYLKQQLKSYWHVEVNDQLRDIVAEYLEPEFFHDVGKKLGVHKNRRTQIELEKSDIVERTYELLGQWHQRQGHNATIGKLVECLELFDPEDFTTILEELNEELGDNYSSFT